MAHVLKYYKDIYSHGHDWRVEILQDTEEALTPMEIGPVLQGLRLVMQGDQADIDTPIVKTSLEMVFVDAPDLEEDRKCGYWEEFYTSSATEYQVKLYKDNILEWTGYVTPDSFSEDLRYRGSVTIIARDNLGAMQDVQCDVLSYANIDGKIRLYALITRALNSVSFAMDRQFEYTESYHDVTLTGVDVIGKYELSGNVFWQMFDAQKLNEMTMWEALEAALYGCGMVLRYVGQNRIVFVPIRSMGLGGFDFWPDVPRRDTAFVAYGHRELSPAVKNVTEEVSYSLAEDDEEDKAQIMGYDETTAGLAITGMDMYHNAAQDPNQLGTKLAPSYNTPVQGYQAPTKWGGTVEAAASCLLDVGKYAKSPEWSSEKYGAWDDKSILYYPMNAVEDRIIRATKKIFSTEMKVNISLTVAHPISFFSLYETIGNTPFTLPIYAGGNAIYLHYVIRHTDELFNVQYYNTAQATWSATSTRNTLPLYTVYRIPSQYKDAELKIEGLEMPATGTLEVEIVRILGAPILVVSEWCQGVYFRIKDFKVNMALDDGTVYKKTKLTTEYSDRNNIKLTRAPKFGINPTSSGLQAYIQEAILTEEEFGYSSAERWVWHEGDEGKPLAALIHQQLLAHYAKPNNVLTGELLDRGGDVPDFRSLWRWNGKDHMLISGSLNVLTGRMENAVLREFMRYDHMWETWAENEDIVVDYPAAEVGVVVHTNEELGPDMVVGLPSWATLVEVADAGDTYEVMLSVQANTTGAERVAYFRIDTAWVRLRQLAAGE